MDDDFDVLHHLAHAMAGGEEAAKAAVSGGDPNLDALQKWADGMNVLREGIAKGTLDFGWVRPTEDDVSAARHLAQLVQKGTPREALLEPALRVLRVTTDPQTLQELCVVLPWLAGEPSRAKKGDIKRV